MTNRPPIEGVEIARRFDFEGPLGEGAMGEVFVAVDRETGQRFAVKLMRQELAADEAMQGRFRNEAVITAAVDHHGGIPVYGFGSTADGRPFYVMKRVEGTTLRDLLDERGPQVHDLLWRRRLLQLFARVCEVIAYAHERGVVHRDLKPDNILVDERDAVTVIDWGLAKQVGRVDEQPLSWADSSSASLGQTVYGDVLGSPGYMAPEQAAGEASEAGPPADVFALGAILYEILTAHNPFPGATPRESMLASIHRDPIDPGKLNRWLWLSHSLIAVCRKALEKEPMQRYGSAGELARDLRRLREGRAATATRPSVAERVRWAARRRPVTFAASSALLAILVLVGLFVLAQFRIDARLAQKAFAEIDEQDRIVEDLTRELLGLNPDSASVTDDEQRRRLEQERLRLETRRLLLEIDSIYLLRDVVRLRFIRRDPEWMPMLKSRLFEVLRSAIDLGEPAIAKAIAETLLVERTGKESLASRLDESDRLRLEALLQDAELALEEAAATAQRLP